MKKFNSVFKAKQIITEKILEGKLLNEFKNIYSALLEQYNITEFYDLKKDAQSAFIHELNEYWTDEYGISKKGVKFLKTKMPLLTEDSTQLQKRQYLKNRSSVIISEILRQSDIKYKFYQILDEMYKNTKSKDISDVLDVNSISDAITESFDTYLHNLITEISYELSSDIKPRK